MGLGLNLQGWRVPAKQLENAVMVVELVVVKMYRNKQKLSYTLSHGNE